MPALSVTYEATAEDACGIDKDLTLSSRRCATKHARSGSFRGRSSANSSPPRRASRSLVRSVSLSLRDVPQALVSCLVAVGVVVGLEVVHVEHDHGVRTSLAPVLLQGAVEGAAVGDARERIGPDQHGQVGVVPGQ